MVKLLTKESKDKRLVTLSSVFAALLLTSGKLIIGLLTGSLGILSEAIHSGLDLVAAIMTYIAVKIADKPPDKDHNYGHGKVENLSALFETFLLFVTCIWIVYEGIDRLISGRTQIDVTFWSFAVIISSIIIDFSRSKALRKVALKYNSQAIEADALHFSTDILSSVVVLLGLFGALFNYHFIDTIAALIVAVIVFYICLRLGKKSIDALIDKSPDNIPEIIQNIISELIDIKKVHDVRIRTSGSKTFIDLNIHVEPDLKIGDAHKIAHQLENLIHQQIERSETHVHIEPEFVEVDN